MHPISYLIVNFGGPRTLKEVEPFLNALLTDKEVIRSKFPQPFHNILFGRLAKKRAKAITLDYEKIGGGSPIWTDTEFVAESLRHKLKAPVLTFHRYLKSTHHAFIEEINALDSLEIRVFPMFPQFTYATTGSIARFFVDHFSKQTLQKFKWVKSYPAHPAFIASTVRGIQEFLHSSGLVENEVFFLFSAHGLPQDFIEQGDLYEYECRLSFNAVMHAFPSAEGILCYQSQFGPGEWLQPYTLKISHDISQFARGRKYCVFVPLSFTSDHIETLFEIEEQYMPLIRQANLHPFRVPALNRRLDWIDSIIHILSDSTPCSTSMLVRNN